MPLVLMFWSRQRKRGREPNEFIKMAIGCWIFGASTLLLAAASVAAGATGRASLAWAVAFHLGSNIGWIFFAPTTTALVSRAAPRQDQRHDDRRLFAGGVPRQRDQRATGFTV